MLEINNITKRVSAWCNEYAYVDCSSGTGLKLYAKCERVENGRPVEKTCV